MRDLNTACFLTTDQQSICYISPTPAKADMPRTTEAQWKLLFTLLNWQSIFPSRKQVSRIYQPQEAENKIGF